MRLKDKVAIVTGGSQGIGDAIAKAYAAEGAAVAIVNHGRPERGQQTAEAISQAGGQAANFIADVARVADCDRVVAEVMKRFSTVDILVNNAGIYRAIAIEDTSEPDWDSIIDTNLKGTFFMTRAVVPELKRKRRGKIVNVASIAGSIAYPASGIYCASKAGMLLLTKSWCLDLAPFGINVNALSPGNTATPLNDHLRADAAYAERIRALTPSGVPFLPTSDMVGAALFLASEESQGMHGAEIVVDGGFTCW